MENLPPDLVHPPNDNGATFQGAEQETQRLKGPPT